MFKISQDFKGKEGAAAAFSKIDINGDGLISKQEMSSAVIGGSKLSAFYQNSVSVQSSSSSFSQTTVTKSSFTSVFVLLTHQHLCSVSQTGVVF